MHKRTWGTIETGKRHGEKNILKLSRKKRSKWIVEQVIMIAREKQDESVG